MPLSGKYDFKGIKKLGALAIQGALSKTAWAVKLAKIPLLGTILNYIPEFVSNWLANNGLVILNVGMNYANGEVDQKAMDKALSDGLAHLQVGRENISPKEGAKIDEEVRKAARNFIPWIGKL